MSALLTEDYRKQLVQMHVNKASFGKGGSRWAPIVKRLSESLGTAKILDYGCGKGDLNLYFPYGIDMYDPGIPKYAEMPRPHDIVVCTDVLEHVEPDHIAGVIEHLAVLTRKALVLNVNCQPAQKHLPDGRNAHLTVKPPEWWLWHMNLENRWAPPEDKPALGKLKDGTIYDFVTILYPREPS